MQAAAIKKRLTVALSGRLGVLFGFYGARNISDLRGFADVVDSSGSRSRQPHDAEILNRIQCAASARPLQHWMLI